MNELRPGPEDEVPCQPGFRPPRWRQKRVHLNAALNGVVDVVLWSGLDLQFAQHDVTTRGPLLTSPEASLTTKPPTQAGLLHTPTYTSAVRAHNSSPKELDVDTPQLSLSFSFPSSYLCPKWSFQEPIPQMKRRTERLSRVGSEVTNLAPRRRTLSPSSIATRLITVARRLRRDRGSNTVSLPSEGALGVLPGITQHDHRLEVVTGAFRGTDAPDEFTWLVR